jgi:predicted naringenin-chalcone synthase
MVRIGGFGVARPETPIRQDEVWEGFFADHFGGSPGARRIFGNAGVDTRYGVANPLTEDLSATTTGQRMSRYAADAPPLGHAATARALQAAGLEPADVGLFAVASCTGYTTPGLDITLAAELGMSADVQRLCIGHMGCYAALPGLGTVTDFAVSRGRPAVLLCLELPTLHIQPPTREVQQIVAHALFGDAAAAVVALPDSGSSGTPPWGLELVDLVARTDPANADYMTWRVTDHGFRMGLSPRVADALSGHVADVVGKLLARHGLTPSDVAGWAVHPGGPRILEVVESQLGLPEDALDVSRATLRDYGNCSSATVLMVLEGMLRRGDIPPSGYVVALAFGPGLTLYAALLRG